MQGWNALRNFLKALLAREMEARNNKTESSEASPLDRETRNTAADWANKRREIQKAVNLDKQQKALRDEYWGAVERMLDAQESERNKGTSSSSEFGGNLAPSPTTDAYGGGVPDRTIREFSSLWIISGKFMIVDSESDNVYAIAYDVDRSSLFVQFKHWEPGMPFGSQNGPGAVYEYKNVSIPEAHSFFRAKSKDDWIWNNLRVRGTWSDHKKPYRLTAISLGYLPRKATWWTDGREWFIRRQMWDTNGMAAYSQLPNRPAPPMGMDGKPQWSKWTPDRGTPNRGTPNRGK